MSGRAKVPLPEVSRAAVGPVCVVTGAGGYLGRWLVEALVDLGCTVRALDRALADVPGAEWVRCDIRDETALGEAFEGADVAFHLAAVIELRGLATRAVRDHVWGVNVGGTDAVLKACGDEGVRKLVYVSSNNVCVDGERIEQDETAPYAARTWDLYTVTKIEAEKRVLAANRLGLRTCALRPGGIWGPGDGGYMLRDFLGRLARGQFVAVIGESSAVGDNTHVFNLVRALLQASAALERPEMGGRAWFVTDDERINPIEWFQPVVAHLGLPWPSRRVPGRVAWAVAALAEWFHRLGGPMPALTRGGVLKVASSTSFRIDAARRDLGYEPIVKRDDGLAAAMSDLERVYREFQEGR